MEIFVVIGYNYCKNVAIRLYKNYYFQILDAIKELEVSMKKIIILIVLVILLKRFGFVPTTILYVAIPLFLVFLLIKASFKAATGSTKRGRTDSMYDDYL